MLRIVLCNAASLLLLAGCERQSTDTFENDQPLDAPSTGSPEDASPADTASRAVMPTVTLLGNGLQVTQAVEGRGTATVLNFGEPRERTLAAMTALLGEPETSSNEECGAGPLEFADFGALTLNFQDGGFVGYSVDDSSTGVELRGPAGLAIGAPRDVVARLDGFQTYEESTLGDEFNVGSGEGNVVVGLFDEDGRVTDLWSGAVCTFR